MTSTSSYPAPQRQVRQRHAARRQSRTAVAVHERRHPRRVRHDPRGRHSAHGAPGGVAAHAARDHRPGPHRDGRRQRRRRRLHLRPGRPELRAQPAVDAAAAHPGAHRQPGDGRPPRRGHRRRPRQVDQRALRASSGRVFSVGDLFLLNFLTIVTEFIGVSLALGYFGVSPYISVPIAALGLVAMTATGSFRRWERFMLLFVVRQLPRHPARDLQPPARRPRGPRPPRARACRAA